MGVLAVDVGRSQLAKFELQNAADAAARYAAGGMARSNTKLATAYDHASVVGAEQRVDGRAVTVSAGDIDVGDWDPATRTFTASPAGGNAVRVRLRTTIGGTNSPALFAALFGGAPRVLMAQSIATASAVSYDVTARSSGNIWLSGMADHTVTTNQQGDPIKYDSSGTSALPLQRPTSVPLASLGVAPGDLVSMDGLNGSGQNSASEAIFGPDGNPGWNVAQGNSAPTGVPAAPDNGISNMRAPISSFIAVFLSDSAPTTSTAPAGLDFATPAQRDFATLSPQLQQSFFIGDGKRDDGEVQTFRVPAGATRVYFGMMDAWQWNDNLGSYHMSLYRAPVIHTVK